MLPIVLLKSLKSTIRKNCFIACSNGRTKPFGTLATNQCVDSHLIGDTICLPLYRYDENGNRIDNITDWGLTQFHTLHLRRFPPSRLPHQIRNQPQT